MSLTVLMLAVYCLYAMIYLAALLLPDLFTLYQTTGLFNGLQCQVVACGELASSDPLSGCYVD
jgi:hypothetical protein